MDRFTVWTVLFVVLAVYTSAQNSNENPNNEDIDQEIDNIAKALDDTIDDQDERDFGAYCDSVCSGRDICDCLDPDCDPDECPMTRDVGDGEDEEELSKPKKASEAVQKKLLRFRISGRRSRRSRFRFIRRILRRFSG